MNIAIKTFYIALLLLPLRNNAATKAWNNTYYTLFDSPTDLALFRKLMRNKVSLMGPHEYCY